MNLKPRIMLIGLIIALCALGAFAQAYRTTEFNDHLKRITKAPVSFDAYERISQNISAYQLKEEVKKLSVTDRLNVWRVQIAWALTFENLSDKERSAIQGIGKFLTVWQFKQPSPEFVAYDDTLKAVFDAHRDLYRKTFEIPGNAVLSDNVTCAPHVKQITVAKLMKPHVTPSLICDEFGCDGDPGYFPSDCNCTWSGGCDGNLPCGQSQTPCTQVINCGPFGLFSCSGVCGGR